MAQEKTDGKEHWGKTAVQWALGKAFSPEGLTLLFGTLGLGTVFLALRRRLDAPVPAWAALLVLALGLAGGYGGSRWRAWRQRAHPTDTMRVFSRRSDWSFGYRDQREFREGRPSSAELYFRCEATNILTDKPIRIVEAQVSLGFLARRVTGWATTRQADGQLFSGEHYIEAGDTTEVSAAFSITPPPKQTKVNKRLVGTVYLSDQWGNRHAVKGAVFKPPQPPAAAASGPTPEKVHAIANPVEKAVVSVLKAEIQRYRGAGSRSHGLLGSLTTRHAGKTVSGLGSDWRVVGSSDNQVLLHDVMLPAVASDNADHLLALHSRLNAHEKAQFSEALLLRVDRNKEYAEVAYLIVLVSFRVGELQRFLPVAKTRLQGDVGFGFGEVLRLLDALLRFEHPSFSDSLLDALEAFVEELPENETRTLRERLFATRAYRVGRPAPAG